ncbi:hypothetical protein [Nocardia carnea]|uniref:hypothetical protein n=1 Tax=Nocardia carnea TaxID=37328 RepID=UPI002456EF54|nr:hypothetical protein [Nocardia carnea]
MASSIDRQSDDRALPGGTTVPPEPIFPSDDELLISMRGRPIGKHPVSTYTYRLSRLHEQQQPEGGAVAGIRWGRHLLVRAIDAWVEHRLPTPHHTAILHTQTIGQVIDHLVAAQVDAYRLLMTLDPIDSRVHAAWTQVAELADEYTDLTTAVLHRSRRLPTPGDHW